ncbi:MAG: transporter substrate-binding domain-containing protein [Pedobacter sp.]
MKPLFIALLLTLVFSYAYSAPPLQLTPEEQTYLQKNPIVHVGIDRNWPPFDYFDPSKGHQGIASNYLDEISKRLGLSVKIYPDDWNTVLELSKTDAIAMLACAARTPQRETYLFFSDPYIYIDVAVFVAKNDTSTRTLSDLYGKTVALPQGNFLQDYLQNNYPAIRLHLTRSNEEAIDLLAMGQVDAYLGNMAVGNYFLEKNIITNAKIAFKIPDEKPGFGFAVNKNNPILYRLVQKALRSIDEDTHRRIRKQWVAYFSEDLSPAVPLTFQEKEWLRRHPVVKVGTGSDWPPYDFKKNGIYQGIANDYLQLIAKKTGLRFDYNANGTWAELQHQLAAGKIELLPAIYLDQTNEQRFLFTDIYTQAKEFMFIREDEHGIQNLADIEDKTAVFVTGSNTIPAIRNLFPSVRIREVETIREALHMLQDGQADFYIDTFGAVGHVSNQSGLAGIKAAFPVKLVATGLRMATNADNRVLLAMLQKALKAITQEEKDAIDRKWLGNSPDSKHKQVLLTETEKAWIKAHPEITIAGDPNREPVSFFTKDEEYAGIISDYLRLIHERTGLRFSAQHLSSYVDAIEALTQQKIDMLDATGYSFERRNFMDFSQQHIRIDNVIVGSDKSPVISRVTELSEKTVGVVQGDITETLLQRDVPDIRLRAFANAESGLKALSMGKLDAFIVDLPTLDFVSEKLGLSNLKVSGGTPYSFPLHFGFRKNQPVLRSIINKALASIDLTERREIYRRWVKFEYEATVDYTLLWQIAGVLLLIIVGTLYWNRRLSQEIRKRIRIEKELKRLHLSLEFTPVSVVMTDDKGRIEYANNAFYEITGFAQDEIIGRNINMFACSANDENLYTNMWQDILRGKTWQAELQFEKKCRKLFWISMVVTPVLNDDATATGFIWVCEDISRRKAAEQELLLAKNAAEQATRAKSEFLANMSHEIRTPMNSVIGFTDLLDDLIEDPLQKSYLRSIKVGGKALLGIINDILDLSKIEAGQLKLEYESINPHLLFGEMEQLFQAKIRQKNLRFIIEIDSKIPDYLILDGIRLRQILFNLIGNAIKFTEKGSITLGVKKVYKDAEQSKLDLVLQIADTGMGIPQKNLDRIFQVFEQQEGQDVRKYGGTGLGLAICKKLVDMMNGEITVTSKVGEGSVFSVTLHDIAVSSVATHNQDATPETDIIFEPATVMVVDDIPDNRTLVKAAFSSTAVTVIEAAHGRDAIAQLQTTPVDLLLMDLRMPVMNGYEATREIRQDEAFRHLPIVALTASVLVDDLSKIENFGFNGYIQKPVEKKQLLRTLSEFLPCTQKAPDDNDLKSMSLTETEEVRAAIAARMENDLFRLWQAVRDKGDIQLIQGFCHELTQLADAHNSTFLKQYTDKLSTCVENFDIGEIYELMFQYPDLIQRIKQTEAQTNV